MLFVTDPGLAPLVDSVDGEQFGVDESFYLDRPC